MAKRINFYFSVMIYVKINSQCIIDLIVKGKTIKFIGENIFNVGLHKDFLDGTPKHN